MNSTQIALGLALVGLLWSSTAVAQATDTLDDRQWHISAQLNASAVTLEDDVLDQEGAATLGGLGVTARLDFPLRAGLEVGFGGVHRESQNGLVKESVFVNSLSGLWYFSRAPEHRFYALVGSSTLQTQRNIGEQTFQFVESGLHIGAGVDFLLGESFLVSLDGRLLGLASDVTDEHRGAKAYPADRSPYPGRWASNPTARGGSRASVAFGYRW